jgi:hypothetical protein
MECGRCRLPTASDTPCMILMKRSARGSGAGVSMRELKQNIGFLGKEFRSVIDAKSL